MAADYTVGPQRQTVFTRGSDDTIDIIEVLTYSKPSQIQFPVRVPVAEATPDIIASIAESNAQQLETIAGEPNVQAVEVTDDLRPDGVLMLGANVYVVSDNGQGQAVVHVPYDSIFSPSFRDQIQPTIDELNAVQAL